MKIEELKRSLVEHKIYSAMQFIDYTNKNIEIVHYCADTLNNIVDKMTIKTVRWHQDLSADIIDDIDENGEKIYKVSLTQENMPVYELRVAGDKVDPWFLFNKLLRDFYQYVMNSFDSISQIINAGLFANKGKKIDSVDIQAMRKWINQQQFGNAFPAMKEWLNALLDSKEFQYIEAINNRTKHTADIGSKLGMGILGSSNTTEIGPFFRKDKQHDKTDILNQLESTLDFLDKSWIQFMEIFKEEYDKDTYIENRMHHISGVRQYRMKDDPHSDLSYAYISTSEGFDIMPDEIRVLLINDFDDVMAHESPFETILVTETENAEVIGRYCAVDKIGDDCLLHYRKYVKDKSTPGILCIHQMQSDKAVFYHRNPYFDVETISDDIEFANRTTLPF